MAARWAQAEDTALINTIGNGVPMNTVLQAVQAAAKVNSTSKTLGAVRTRARNKRLSLDYRGSDKTRKFHKGVPRRQHKKKTEFTTNEEATIVGELKTATTVQAPTITSETINTESDESIAQNGNREAYIAIYENFSTLMENEDYSSVEVSAVTLNGLKVTISKDSI